jgi:hypothetical protein
MPEQLLSAIAEPDSGATPTRRDHPLCMEILSLTQVDVQFLVSLLYKKGVASSSHKFNALIKVFRQLAEFDQMQNQNRTQYTPPRPS